MKKYRVTCPICELSFEIDDSDYIKCDCCFCAEFENGHLVDGVLGSPGFVSFEIRNLITGEEYIESSEN